MPPKPGENNPPENILEENPNQEEQIDPPVENIDPNQVNLDGENLENNNVLPPDEQNVAEADPQQEEAGEDAGDNLNIEEERKQQALDQEIAAAPDATARTVSIKRAATASIGSPWARTPALKSIQRPLFS